jgi:hypothetical protein
MNDVSNTITGYLQIRDLIRDYYENPKVMEATVTLLEVFIDQQETAFEKAWSKVVAGTAEDIEPLNIQDLKHDALYQNDPAYTENNKEQIYKNYRAAIDEYNKLQKEYDSLQLDYEHLQDLFYRVDSEHDELKVKYDECQKNYHIVVSEMKHCVEELNQ